MKLIGAAFFVIAMFVVGNMDHQDQLEDDKFCQEMKNKGLWPEC